MARIVGTRRPHEEIPRPGVFEVWRHPAEWSRRAEVARAVEALCAREKDFAEYLPGIMSGDPSALRKLAWKCDEDGQQPDFAGTALWLAWTTSPAPVPGLDQDTLAAHRLAALLELWRYTTRCLHHARDGVSWANLDADKNISSALYALREQALRNSLRVLVVALRRAVEETVDTYSWSAVVKRVGKALTIASPEEKKTPTPKLVMDDDAEALQGPSAVVAPNYKSNSANGRGERLKPLAGPLPLAVMPSAVEITRRLAALTDEAPNLAVVFSRIRQDLALRRASGQITLQLLRPILLVGPPGCGKSRAAQRVAEALGWPSATLEMSTADDHRIGGTGRGWSSSHAAWPVEAVAELRCANPLLVLDELGRGQAHSGGRAEDALHGMLEAHTASRFSDPVAGVCDLSMCSWIATANPDSLRKVPASVLSRFRVVEIEPLPLRSFGTILASVLDDLARKHGFERREFLPALEPEEKAFLEAQWHSSGGNARMLAKLVERILGGAAERDEKGRPH